MEELFDHESVNLESATAFAECIIDLTRLIKKMETNRVRLLISQKSSHSAKGGFKLSTKLTLRNYSSCDEVDVFVSDEVLVDDSADEWVSPTVRLSNFLPEHLRCFLVSHHLQSHSISEDLDQTVREVAELGDFDGIVQKLDDSEE